MTSVESALKRRACFFERIFLVGNKKLSCFRPLFQIAKFQSAVSV